MKRKTKWISIFKNEELENRIIELENSIQIQRINNRRANEERDWKIKELRSRLDNLGRDYHELVSTKASLNSEISIYRRLIEQEENRFLLINDDFSIDLILLFLEMHRL